MKKIRLGSPILLILFLGSCILNIFLFYRMYAYKKFSIDLRHVSVSVSSRAPEVSGVKDLFTRGDGVITVIDEKRSNSIIMLCRENKGTDLIWNVLIQKDGLLRGGAPSPHDVD